jgi:hypothetical protein
VAGHRSADRCPQPRMDALPGPRRPGPDHGRPRRHTAGRARRRPPRARSAAPSPPALKSSRRSSRRHEPRSPHRARADERHDRVPSLQHLDAPRASRPRCRSRCPAPLAVAPLVPPSTRDLIPHLRSGSARRSEPWSPGVLAGHRPTPGYAHRRRDVRRRAGMAACRFLTAPAHAACPPDTAAAANPQAQTGTVLGSLTPQSRHRRYQRARDVRHGSTRCRRHRVGQHHHGFRLH